MILSSLFFISLLDAVLPSPQHQGISYQKGKLPYQVSVEVVGEFRCSGAIINGFWVKTVAACLQNVSASEVIVRAAAGVTQRRGSAHKVHQLLIFPSCSADDCLRTHVALLKVHTRFKFSRMIRPVTLWPRAPPPGDTGWSSTWPCHQDYVTIKQRRVAILDSASCSHMVTTPEVMCLSSLDEHSRNDDIMCQNTGALVVIRNRLAGFVLTSYNSTVDICVSISPYISWIKQTAFGVM